MDSSKYAKLTEADLDTMKIAQLRVVAKDVGAKGNPKTKPELVASILATIAARAPVEKAAVQQAAKPKTKKEVAAKVADGLGAIVWYDLTATKITPDALRTILTEEHVELDVPDIDQDQAVRQAAREWRQGRGNAERYRTEVVFEDAARIVVGVLKREQIDTAEAAWRQVDAVSWDVPILGWGTHGGSSEVLAFMEHADSMRTHHDHRFIRPELLQASLARMGAFGLRRQGGCYYVPVQHLGELDKLQRVVDRIGDCALDYTHVAQSEAGQRALGREANDTLETQLGEVMTQLDGWAESTRRVSTASQESVLGTFADLRARARLYADALQVSLDGVLGKVASAEDRCREILAGRQPTEGARSAPSTSSIERSQKLLGLSSELGNGSRFASAQAIEEAGFPPAATHNRGMWSAANTLGAGMLAIGFRPMLQPGEGVILRPVPAPQP